jgi:hypothetical protein
MMLHVVHKAVNARFFATLQSMANVSYANAKARLDSLLWAQWVHDLALQGMLLVHILPVLPALVAMIASQQQEKVADNKNVMAGVGPAPAVVAAVEGTVVEVELVDSLPVVAVAVHIAAVVEVLDDTSLDFAVFLEEQVPVQM